MIIGLMGHLNSGKGVVADILKEEHNFYNIAFGDAIKRALQFMFDIPDDELWGPSENRAGKTREMLQVLGTNFARKYDPDVWLNLLRKRLEHWRVTGFDMFNIILTHGKLVQTTNINLVISDVRFLNEAKYVAGECASPLLKIVRPGNYELVKGGAEAMAHESETAVNKIPQEYITETIMNDTDLDTFKNNVREVLCKILP